MNKIFDNKQEFTELYRDAVMSISGKSVEAASDLDRFNALAKLVAEKARTVATKSDARATAEGKKRVYYFSIEFLIGRLLDNYLLNFGVRDMVAEALDDMGFDLSVIENQEPDPALGNGGLGRLAACFLDSMAAEGIAGYGNGCATATACLSRRSSTAARSRPPTSGSPTAIPGRSVVRTRP